MKGSRDLTRTAQPVQNPTSPPVPVVLGRVRLARQPGLAERGHHANGPAPTVTAAQSIARQLEPKLACLAPNARACVTGLVLRGEFQGALKKLDEESQRLPELVEIRGAIALVESAEATHPRRIMGSGETRLVILRPDVLPTHSRAQLHIWQLARHAKCLRTLVARSTLPTLRTLEIVRELVAADHLRLVVTWRGD